MGTPQARCREMHQSGRVVNMPVIRSRPHSGIQRTASASATAVARRPSIAMNHCGVARKMTGEWQRQQCGYVCWMVVRNHSRPRSASVASTTGLASKTFNAAHHADVRVEAAVHADRRVDVEAVLRAGDEVVRAVARRRVHRAGALVERHVLAEHGQRIALVERVPEHHALEQPGP